MRIAWAAALSLATVAGQAGAQSAPPVPEGVELRGFVEPGQVRDRVGCGHGIDLSPCR